MHENLTPPPMSPNVSDRFVVPGTTKYPVQGSFFETGLQTTWVQSNVTSAVTAIVPPVESEKTLESLFEAFHILWNSSDVQEDLEQSTESNNARETPEGFRRAYTKSFLLQHRIKGNTLTQMNEAQFIYQYERWAVRKTTESINTKVGALVAPQEILPVIATESHNVADADTSAVNEARWIIHQETEINHLAYEIQALTEELMNLHAEILDDVESLWLGLTQASGEYEKMDEADAVRKLGAFVYRELSASLPNNGYTGLPESQDPLAQLGKLLSLR